MIQAYLKSTVKRKKGGSLRNAIFFMCRMLHCNSYLTIQYSILFSSKVSNLSSLNSWEAQVRKGILEFLVLTELSASKGGYGYDIFQKIKIKPSMDVTESAIYPILNKLAKDGLLESVKEKSALGPPRRRYSVTALGEVRRLHMSYFIKDLITTLEENTKKL